MRVFQHAAVAAGNARGGGKVSWRPPRLTPLFFMQLAIVLLLVLALAQPFVQPWAKSATCSATR